MKRQSGFTLVEVAVVVLVVGLIGFIGLRVWGSYSTGDVATQNSSTPTVAKITSIKDLDTVDKQLDSTDVVGSFESELDSEADF